ncbi:hypothetical protein JCM6882_004216 [Rhodosporidiobolus microsporus]
MFSADSTPASSAAPSPYLPQHASVPLLRDYDQPKEIDSPTLPAFPADKKRRAYWQPSSRLILPLVVLTLAITSLFLLASNLFPPLLPGGTYYDSLYEAVSSSPSPERIHRWFTQPPEQPLAKEGIVVVEASAEHTVSAIVIPGLGGTAWDWPFYQTLAGRYPYVRWVSPTADYMNVTVRNGERARAWFDIETFDDLYQNEDVAGYAHSLQQINQLVEQERQLLISQGKEPRIAMLGFSQGGVMTLLSTLLAQDPSRFEAGVVFSTYLPMIDNIASLISPSARNFPLFWAHGRADGYLTFAHAKEGVELLRSDAVGMKNLEFRGYEGLQHAWAHKELSDLVRWFGHHVPFYRTHPTTSSSIPSPTSSSPAAPSDDSFPFTDDERKEMQSSTDGATVAGDGEAPQEDNAVAEVEALEVAAELQMKRMRLMKRRL